MFFEGDDAGVELEQLVGAGGLAFGEPGVEAEGGEDEPFGDLQAGGEVLVGHGVPRGVSGVLRGDCGRMGVASGQGSPGLRGPEILTPLWWAAWGWRAFNWV